MKSSATWRSYYVMRLGMDALSELAALEVWPQEKTADGKAWPVRRCEWRYRRYKRPTRQTSDCYSVSRATRRSMKLLVGVHSKVMSSSCSRRDTCVSMSPIPTCLISRLHHVLACLISAVCLGDGSTIMRTCEPTPVPLLPKFAPEVAAMHHELRKRGTSTPSGKELTWRASSSPWCLLSSWSACCGRSWSGCAVATFQTMRQSGASAGATLSRSQPALP
jgi:hypothetical protein